MAKRKIINIDEEKCDGCGLCIPNCPEGALQIIDGKARLVSDLFCDGLGACIGHCPQGAISIEEKEAEPYNEKRAMENIVKQGENTIKAHLKHLKEHNQDGLLEEAIDFLKEKGIEVPESFQKKETVHTTPSSNSTSCGCPGSTTMDFRSEQKDEEQKEQKQTAKVKSQLRQWPIQMHLISPTAPYYQGADVLLVADCVGYSLGEFHTDYLKGKSIGIACPKLDEGRDAYQGKITSWIDDARINTLTVMIMQVPCCRGLLNLAQEAAQQAKRKVPIKYVVVSPRGEILEEKWVST